MPFPLQAVGLKVLLTKIRQYVKFFQPLVEVNSQLGTVNKFTKRCVLIVSCAGCCQGFCWRFSVIFLLIVYNSLFFNTAAFCGVQDCFAGDSLFRALEHSLFISKLKKLNRHCSNNNNQARASQFQGISFPPRTRVPREVSKSNHL